ncbi:purine and uridine phosphorylase [Aspergillus pseudotamarii]|uniref:Purine and uridine phosphorylase n=1 Tax=Aspergillus pseudotamarii TaxID=132259 RepID=A0A5N6TA88_ASPPS|nr:purine and uridine phosphorylase [Aspergillus pseudotamarii]KAE8143190.1 purine and uridine phosphorylase [Aspergillus pseudotamarii]
MKPSPYTNDEYTIGWISASNEERYQRLSLGKVGEQNVAMACLSGGQTGTGPADIVAENMRRTFKNIRFTLLVGTGGGVPRKKKDIRLGDVVVSYPSGSYNGIVQYDYGKLKNNGHVQRKDWFSAPPRKLLAAVDLLRAYHARPKKPINNKLGIIDELGEKYGYPEDHIAPDLLYQSDYEHDPKAETCDSCDRKALIQRKSRNSPCKPYVHYGVIASGNMVAKSGIERDKIDQRYENSILCFEMEAAGLINNFPCLVIQGISNYSDSHKNDQWQKCAIAAASAYAKELLLLIEPSDMKLLPPIVARMLHTGMRLHHQILYFLKSS